METLKANARQTKEFIIDCITAPGGAVVPFVKSSPAIGKSAIVRSIAKEYNLELLDHRLSTSTPEDLQGLPRFRDILNEDSSIHKTVAEFAPFEMFPTEGDPLPKDKDGWLLFLDEFNSATKLTQAAAYKLVLDKGVGQKKLHERCVIVAAGNLATDRAIVNPLSTAMQSRVVHINMQFDARIFLDDVVIAQNWDYRLLAYLSFMTNNIYDFRPDHNDDTFCSPRTWEFVNKIILGREFKLNKGPNGEIISYDMDLKAPLLAGAVTSGKATEFIQFTRVFDKIPSIQSIISDPYNAEVPTDRGLMFATITGLMSAVTEENFDKILVYVNRYILDFRVLFIRALLTRNLSLKGHPTFRQALVELNRYLYD